MVYQDIGPESTSDRGRCSDKWHPSYMGVRYEDWVKNLEWDWCISRQRYHGVPFPVWYCTKCEKIQIADVSELPIDPRVKPAFKAVFLRKYGIRAGNKRHGYVADFFLEPAGGRALAG